MKVNVGRLHITEGKCGVAKYCMIAAAIKEYDPTVSYVAVRTNGITITRRRKNGNSVRQHYAVPTKAARAIIAFDMGQPVEPFSFECKLIDEEHIPEVAYEQARLNNKRTRKRRAALAAAGIPQPKYGTRARVAGV